MTAPCAIPIDGPPVTSFKSLYFGAPGAMTGLRLPDAGYTSGDMSRAEVAHTLLSGGVAVTRRRKVKRQWVLGSSGNTPDMADVLLGYYSGARGIGPWAFVDPAWRNQIALDDSTMGAAFGSDITWSTPPADLDTLTRDPAVPPVTGTGVLRWPTPVNTHHMFQSAVYAIPDGTTAVPYIAAQPFTASIYLRTASGTSSATVAVLGCNATTGYDGASTVSVASGTLNTTWKRIVVSGAAGVFTANNPPFLCLDIQCTTASSPDLLIAGAQLVYGVSAAVPWVTGFGAARVVLAAGVPSKSTIFWRRDHSYTLSEV